MFKRLIVDMSSLCWTYLLKGKDTEFGIKVEHNGRTVNVNSAQYGYDQAIDLLTSVMEANGIPPYNVVLVLEGKNSKARRQALCPGYKSGRDSRPPEAYEQFNLMKQRVCDALNQVGATVATQDGVEGDDVIAFLCKELDGEKLILSNDNDLCRLLSPQVSQYRMGTMLTFGDNPKGPFDSQFITLEKALVGGHDDLKGAIGFGETAWKNMLVWAPHNGVLKALEGMIVRKKLHELADDIPAFPPLKKIMESAETVYQSYSASKLYPEWVNTLRQPLQITAGMTAKIDEITDERLRRWGQKIRLVTAENYAQAVDFFKSRIDETPFFSLDLETTVPEESDAWLAQRSDRGGGVDVIASTITGCSVTFGNNGQFTYYVSLDHRDTLNVTVDQLSDFLRLIPTSKVTVAHNAAGFELPVLFNTFGEMWKNNGWRGFFPNMVDSRIAASYWNENQRSFSLKPLSLSLLGYGQVTYEEVTTMTGHEDTLPAGGQLLDREMEYKQAGTKTVPVEDENGMERLVEVPRLADEATPTGVVTKQYKMNELTAEHVLNYGADDTITAYALYNLFSMGMEMDGTLEAFMRLEQKPMYLSAMSFLDGIRVDLERLMQLKGEDERRRAELRKKLDSFLIEKGWSGTVCPQFTELNAANVKEAVRIVLGDELKTMVRTVSKLAVLVAQIDHPRADLLSKLIESGDLEKLNQAVDMYFEGKPDFDVASPKQVQSLVYGVMGIPVRLRNKPTQAMRDKGIREGTPRTDDDALKMAIKQGDVDGPDAEILETLIELKSINTRFGLYWEPYPRRLHWKTGRMHPELRQSATNTRRHTAANPNIQQMDGDSNGVRSVILGHHRNAIVASLDESGQELRLAADYSRDSNFALCYVGDPDQLRDVHSMVASKTVGCSYEEFMERRSSPDPEVATKADKVRKIAKICVFASFYGAMAPKIAETLGITEQEAQSYIDAIYTMFPGLSEWKSETEEFAQIHGWVPVIGGTVRHLREALLSDNKWEAQKACRQASNSRIQGGGGNQLKTIMSDIWDSDIIEKYDYRWMFPVHDETVHSIGDADAVPCLRELHGIMVKPFLETIPSASSVGVGKNYGQLIEIGEVFDEGKLNEALAKLVEREAVHA